MRAAISASVWSFLFALVCGLSPSFARAAGITYQGHIFKPDGTALSGATAHFKLQLRTPDSGACLMYEETQTLDMSQSNGLFSLTLNDGTGSRTDSTGLSLDQIFSNHSQFTLNSANCAGGTGIYNPVAGDGRSLVVLFKDETMAAWEPIPSQKISYVPYAFEADQISGFTPASLVRVAESDGTLDSVSPLSNANYTELLAIIGGTTAQYQKAGKLNGATVPSMTPGQVLGWNGSAWTSVDPLSGVQAFAKTALPTCGANQFLKDNGAGALTCVTQTAGGAGTVTQVDTGTGLTGGPVTSTGTISLATLGTAGTGAVKINYDVYGRVTGATTLAESDIPTLSTAGKVSGSAMNSGTIGGTTAINTSGNIVTTGTISSGAITSSGAVSGTSFTAPAASLTSIGTQSVQIFETTNSYKVTLQAPAALGANYALTLPTTAGASGQVLTTSGAGGVLTWSTPAGTGISALTGDVTASGTGSVAATVALVNGMTAANVSAGAGLANAATNANTASTIVKRDGSGNFAATAASLSSVVYKDSGSNTVTVSAPATVGTSYSLKWPTGVAGAAGQVLTSDLAGNLSWTTPSTTAAPTGSASGDLSGTYPGPTVATVGTSTAANVHSAEVAANAATALNTNSKIVSRDGSGNFAANVVTGNGFTLNNAGSLLNIVNPVGGAWTMTLPATAGSGGQILSSTDGTGLTSWIPAPVSSQWATNGSGINYNSGKVGIGTTTPNNYLHVYNNTNSSIVLGNFENPNAGGSALSGVSVTSASNVATLKVGGAASTNSAQLITNSPKLDLQSNNASGNVTISTNGSERMRVDSGGNVGIGTTAPAAMLDVAGAIRVAGNGSETCDSTHYVGGIRYSAGNIQFCNGTSWATLGVAGAGITALTGDVTASGTGSVGATVAQVGGVTAANVASGANLANAATNANTASTIVKRDGSGNFTASNASLSSVAFKDSGSNTVTVSAPTTVGTSYSLKWPTGVAGSSGQVLTSDTSGNLSWTTPSSTAAPTGAASGDLSGTYPGPTVATIGTSTAANVHSAEVAANAATALNTNSKIVSRDGSGNFAANVVTGNGFTLNNAGSLLNIVNPVGGAWTMTLPATAGSSGQVLTSGGVGGLLSWSAPLSSTSAFINGGNSFGAAAALGTTDNFDLAIKTNNTAKMTILAGGNVGIGTTAPSSSLEITSADTVSSAGGLRISETGTSSGYISLADSTTSANQFSPKIETKSAGPTRNLTIENNISAANDTGSTPVLAFNAVAASASVATRPIFDFQNNGASKLMMLATGNVGIGTTAPGAPLDVAGAIRIAGTGSETCDSTHYVGGIRYSSGNIQFCNGTSWASLGVAGSGITALTGDVTATGSGSVASTVALVGGVSAANVASGANLANAATNANTVSTIVKRDGSGNFTAGTATLTSASVSSVVYKDSGSNTVTLSAPTTVGTSYSLKWPTGVAGAVGQVLTSDTSGNLSWTTPSTTAAPSGSASGDLSGTYPGPTVATVGTSTAANIHTAELAANGATALNTVSKIVARDPSGNFAANVVTGNGLTLNNGGSLLNIVNPIGGAWTMTLPATAGTSGQVLTSGGAGGLLSWSSALTSTTGFVNGGNSFGAAASVGTSDNFDLAIKTNNTTKMTVQAGGNVGIGTTAPDSKLVINGAARNLSSISNTTGPVDFSTGNLQYTSNSCGAFSLYNLKDGGTYTMAVQGTTSGTCSFTAYTDAGATALTVKLPPDHAATTAGKHTLYTFMVMGGYVYVAWNPGY